MDRPDRLDVYFGDELVGAIHDTSPVAFRFRLILSSRRLSNNSGAKGLFLMIHRVKPQSLVGLIWTVEGCRYFCHLPPPKSSRAEKQQ